jgi:hypothetical protein
MATWKRLTEVHGDAVDVNMDWIAYMQKVSNSTTEIFFATGTGRKGSVQVTETPKQIHQMHPTWSYT